MYPDYNLTPQRPELAELMLKVESLGVSCELGLVQRHCTVETIGLFRFGYTPVDGLVRALRADLDEVGSLERLRAFDAENLEYFVTHQDYGFEFHTYLFSDRMSEDELLRKMSAHYKFLARKLREEFGNGEKLFVCRSENHAPSGEDALRLCEAMHRFGEPVLLWVELTDDPAKFGTAEWTVPGKLMTGYLDWFAKTNYAAAMSFDCWVKLLQAAVALWERMPAHCDIKLAAARRAKGDGDYGRVFQILTELLERYPDRPEPFVDSAILLSDLRRPGEAEALLSMGLERWPDNPELLREHARLANARG